MTTQVFGIDPGPALSGVVWFNGQDVLLAGHLPNQEVLEAIQLQLPATCAVVVEKVVSYGRVVGGSTLETCVWTGRFLQAAEERRPRLLWDRLAWRDVHAHFTRARVSDAEFRELLAARFGGCKVAKGTKKTPGPLYVVSGHAWDALAVALAWWDRQLVAQAMTTTEGD